MSAVLMSWLWTCVFTYGWNLLLALDASASVCQGVVLGAVLELISQWAVWEKNRVSTGMKRIKREKEHSPALDPAAQATMINILCCRILILALIGKFVCGGWSLEMMDLIRLLTCYTDRLEKLSSEMLSGYTYLSLFLEPQLRTDHKDKFGCFYMFPL